jgi:predicted CopG family antitoxin
MYNKYRRCLFMKRLNITIPDKLYEQLKPLSNKSRFISEVVREKLEEAKNKKLDKLLIEGYKSSRQEDKEVNEEWEDITLEGWL